MTKCELKLNTMEVKYKDRTEICEGCTLQQDSYEPELIRNDFASLEESLEELEKYTSTVEPFEGATGLMYTVKEYYVEQNEYDDDGEWTDGGDAWFANMDTSKVEA